MELRVDILIPEKLLSGIFDECDRYDTEETGGRLLGFYSWKGIDLRIEVNAVIPAGPNTRRSATHLFQDGDYQERLFRSVEKQHPRIEHLGNWHTHHVNSLRSLSSGDCDTYGKCVNSPNHNTDFFYALLVTHRCQGAERYGMRNYIFFRHGKNAIEVPPLQVTVGNFPILRLS